MAWYNLNHTDDIAKEFSQERIIDRCIFCGQHKEIKTKMTIFFSEFETNIRKERQKVGIERIKQLGKKYGGNDFISDEVKEKVIDLKKNGLSYRKIKDKIDGVSLGSISNIIKEHEVSFS